MLYSKCKPICLYACLQLCTFCCLGATRSGNQCHTCIPLGAVKQEPQRMEQAHAAMQQEASTHALSWCAVSWADKCYDTVEHMSVPGCILQPRLCTADNHEMIPGDAVCSRMGFHNSWSTSHKTIGRVLHRQTGLPQWQDLRSKCRPYVTLTSRCKELHGKLPVLLILVCILGLGLCSLGLLPSHCLQASNVVQDIVPQKVTCLCSHGW